MKLGMRSLGCLAKVHHLAKLKAHDLQLAGFAESNLLHHVGFWEQVGSYSAKGIPSMFRDIELNLGGGGVPHLEFGVEAGEKFEHVLLSQGVPAPAWLAVGTGAGWGIQVKCSATFLSAGLCRRFLVALLSCLSHVALLCVGGL